MTSTRSSDVYGLSSCDRDREIWLRYAMARYGFVREECEEIFQDCLLHCWLMCDLLLFGVWKWEFRKHLYNAWKVKRGWRDRYHLEMDAPLSHSDEGDSRVLADVMSDNGLSVELQVVCRQEGAVWGNRFWDEYEKLNRSHKKEKR